MIPHDVYLDAAVAKCIMPIIHPGNPTSRPFCCVLSKQLLHLSMSMMLCVCVCAVRVNRMLWWTREKLKDYKVELMFLVRVSSLSIHNSWTISID